MARRQGEERRRVERRRADRRNESRFEAARRPAEQRQHARYDTSLPVRIFRRGEYDSDDVMFQASVGTIDISVGGVFLESTFFLKKGLKIELEIELPDMDRKVHMSGQVARIIDDPDKGTTGFAIRFTEYHGEAEIYLRAFLTQGDMVAFVEQYGKEILPKLPNRDRPKLVELIVRWEIYQEEIRRSGPRR